MVSGPRSAVSFTPYAAEDQAVWDAFVRGSKNGLFLFLRAYLEYHSDRFADDSRIAWKAGRPIALLPANRTGETVVSHGGLTFGGFVTDNSMRAAPMLELFDRLLELLGESGATELVYKAVPHVYHRAPAEEDIYALHKVGARLAKREISSAIHLASRPRPSKGRRWMLARAGREGLEIRPSDDYETFMKIVEERVQSRYGVTPTHSAAELRLLAERFPDEIALVGAFRGAELLAGVVIYASGPVAHTQYIGTTAEGREIGAGDLVIEHLISERYSDREWFSFGISTEKDGRHLNESLIEYKESFGARAIVHDTYSVSLA